MNTLWSSRQHLQVFNSSLSDGVSSPPSCAVVSPPRKQLRGQCWLLSPEGPREYKDHTVPGAWRDASSAPGAMRLQAASSLGFTWQSHDLIPNTEHSAALQIRPLKRSHWHKSPEQWLPASAWNNLTICLKRGCIQFSHSQNNRDIFLVTSTPRDTTTMTHLAALEVPVQIPIKMKTHSKRRISEDYVHVSTSSPKNNLIFFPYSYNLKVHKKQSACPYYFQVADPKYFH